MVSLTKEELVREVKKKLVGRVIKPIFPNFIPFVRVQESRNRDPFKPGFVRRAYFRKIGNVVPDEAERYERKIPVVVLDIADETVETGFPPTTQNTPNEIWIKCLWDKQIVFHRVSDKNIHILEQQVVDEL